MTIGDVIQTEFEAADFLTSRRFSIETATGSNIASFTWDDPNGTATIVDYSNPATDNSGSNFYNAFAFGTTYQINIEGFEPGSLTVAFRRPGFSNIVASYTITVRHSWESIVADMVANNPHSEARTYDFTVGAAQLPIRLSENMNCPGETGPTNFSVSFVDRDSGQEITALDTKCDVTVLTPEQNITVVFTPTNTGTDLIEWMDEGGLTQSSTITSSVALPITLLEFSVVADAKAISLNWSTALESQNATFHVEHRMDIQDWSDISMIPGAGNSTEIRDYTFVHQNPAAGTNHYRLRQTDFDGTFTYSEIRTVEFVSDEESLLAYPNPATDLVTVIVPEAFQDGRLQLYTTNGAPVRKQAASNTTLNIAGLVEGTYIIQVTAKKGILQHKLVVR